MNLRWFWMRPLLRELKGIRSALEMRNRIAAMQLEHETGRNAMVMFEAKPAHGKDESSVSAPDYAFIAQYNAAAAILSEQLGREPSEEEVNQLLEGGPQGGAPV